MNADIKQNAYEAWEATRALPLHLIRTHVDRVPRESRLRSVSGVFNGVRGRSAGSVITTMALIPHNPSIGAKWNTGAPGRLGTETFLLGRSARWSEKPGRGGAGKGEGAGGTTAGTAAGTRGKEKQTPAVAAAAV